MRALAIALAVVTTTGVARADDEDDDDVDDEDATFVANKRFSIGVSVGGHSTRVADKSESGFGTALELALGRDRWQYFIEGGIATSHVMPAANATTTIDGNLKHAGLGARWIARQFRPGSDGGIEMFLVSRVGMEWISLDDNKMSTRRPELAFGFGLQGRIYGRPRLAFRLEARVLATPNESPGFSGGGGFAW